MEITCLQMDVLLTFYLDGELSNNLKLKVEEHLKNCPSCRAKFDIISSLFTEIRAETNVTTPRTENISERYHVFKNNLSAYIDNELPENESIKLKKYAINNTKAREDLEGVYNMRKLMQKSFNKTKSLSKNDFSKKILKQIKPQDKTFSAFNPLIKVASAFVTTVLALSAIIIFCLSLS